MRVLMHCGSFNKHKCMKTKHVSIVHLCHLPRNYFQLLKKICKMHKQRVKKCSTTRTGHISCSYWNSSVFANKETSDEEVDERFRFFGNWTCTKDIICLGRFSWRIRLSLMILSLVRCLAAFAALCFSSLLCCFMLLVVAVLYSVPVMLIAVWFFHLHRLLLYCWFMSHTSASLCNQLLCSALSLISAFDHALLSGLFACFYFHLTFYLVLLILKARFFLLSLRKFVCFSSLHLSSQMISIAICLLGFACVQCLCVSPL